MPSVKLIVVFFVRLVVCYGLLMLPWPGLEETYADLFRTGAEAVFGNVGSPGAVTLVPGPPTDVTHDTDLYVRNHKTGAEPGLGISSRYGAYVPTIFFLALIVATPLTWKRKGWALFWGLLGVHFFIGLVLLLQILYMFTGPTALFTLSPLWRRLLAGTVQIINVAPLTWLIVPTFIWIMVTFRRDDVGAILARTNGTRAGSGRGS